VGLWIPVPSLEAEETLLWRKIVNREQSSTRSVGGRLYLTDRRFIFRAHLVDRLTGGLSWEVVLPAVRRIDIEPGTHEIPRPGAAAHWRRRLRIMTIRGPEFFVINDVEEVVKACITWRVRSPWAVAT